MAGDIWSDGDLMDSFDGPQDKWFSASVQMMHAPFRPYDAGPHSDYNLWTRFHSIGHKSIRSVPINQPRSDLKRVK